MQKYVVDQQNSEWFCSYCGCKCTCDIDKFLPGMGVLVKIGGLKRLDDNKLEVSDAMCYACSNEFQQGVSICP